MEIVYGLIIPCPTHTEACRRAAREGGLIATTPRKIYWIHPAADERLIRTVIPNVRTVLSYSEHATFNALPAGEFHRIRREAIQSHASRRAM
jgi:hypothetical protein